MCAPGVGLSSRAATLTHGACGVSVTQFTWRHAVLARVVFAMVAIVFAAASPAFPQSYPTKPIRLVSPNPPGGANDTLARILAGKMSGILNGKIVIDNRGGAGGQIGGELI